MSNNSKNTVTPADVAAKAVEDKLVTETVPAQPKGDQETVVVEEQVELTIVEGEKKTFKERLAVVTEKLKENKKALIAVGATAGVAAIAFLQYAKNKAAEVIEENSTEESVETAEENDTTESGS